MFVKWIIPAALLAVLFFMPEYRLHVIWATAGYILGVIVAVEELIGAGWRGERWH